MTTRRFSQHNWVVIYDHVAFKTQKTDFVTTNATFTAKLKKVQKDNTYLNVNQNAYPQNVGQMHFWEIWKLDCFRFLRPNITFNRKLVRFPVSTQKDLKVCLQWEDDQVVQKLL